jgi:hypothetical protein
MISRQGNALQTFGAGAITLALVAAYAGCGGSNTASLPEGAGSPDSGAIEGGSVSTQGDGGKTGPGNDGGTTGANDAAPDNYSPPSSTYPAFAVDVAQVIDNGGPVLSAPVVVTVTWSSDPNAATYDALGDAIGASAYWKAINSEYGVGPLTSGTANHVSITTAPPASFADSDLDTLVETNAGASWPASTTNTIYAVYLPPGTTLTSGGR